jgi:long-subunit fatty acid transport protein
MKLKRYGFIVRLKFQKRSALKFISRTIPHSGGYNTTQLAAEFFPKLALAVIPVIVLLGILLCLPRDGAAAIFEQLAMDARGTSLCNSVTADPSGPMSVHYNPAGLDRTVGTEAYQGLIWAPVLNVKGKFTQGTDPSTGKLWAPFGGWFNNGIDPEAGHGSSTTPSIELPFLGKIPMIAPTSGVAHHDKDSPFAYGFAITTPYAAGMTHPDADDPYRFLGKSSTILRIVASPGVSYRVTNNLAIGASFGLGMGFFGMQNDMRAPNDMVALTGALGQSTKGLEIPIVSELTLPAPWFGGGMSPYETMASMKLYGQDLLNTSYNIGFLWDPFSWLSFGGVYQSQATAEIKGRYTFTYSQDMQNSVNWMGSSPLLIVSAAMLGLQTHLADQDSGNFRSDLVFPQRVQFGIKLQPHPRIKFLVDANWTDWESWKAISIVFDRDLAMLQLARLLGYTGGINTLTIENGFKNTWNLSYGLELQASDHLTLRLGYEDRPTSNTASYFGAIPLGDMKFYSVGIGIKQEKVPLRKIKGLSDLIDQMNSPDLLDLSVTYMTSEYKCDFNQSQNFNSTDFTKMVYNPFAGLTYEQKTEAWIIILKQTYYW